MTLRPIQMYRPQRVWTLPGVAIAHRTVSDDIVGTSRQSGMGVKPGGDTATPRTGGQTNQDRRDFGLCNGPPDRRLRDSLRLAGDQSTGSCSASATDALIRQLHQQVEPYAPGAGDNACPPRVERLR